MLQIYILDINLKLLIQNHRRISQKPTSYDIYSNCILLSYIATTLITFAEIITHHVRQLLCWVILEKCNRPEIGFVVGYVAYFDMTKCQSIIWFMRNFPNGETHQRLFCAADIYIQVGSYRYVRMATALCMFWCNMRGNHSNYDYILCTRHVTAYTPLCHIFDKPIYISITHVYAYSHSIPQFTTYLHMWTHAIFATAKLCAGIAYTLPLHLTFTCQTAIYKYSDT